MGITYRRLFDRDENLNESAPYRLFGRDSIAEATFYLWKKKYGSLGVPEVRELRQMREENARLKRLVADLTLDKQILQEVIRKKV